jgi:uncharacterized protein (DUF4415 family)
MKKRKPLTSEEGEVRELGTEDFKHFRPAREVLTSGLRAKLATCKRGPQKPPTKEPITIRLSREVVEQSRVTGEGWQGHADTASRVLTYNSKLQTLSN